MIAEIAPLVTLYLTLFCFGLGSSYALGFLKSIMDKF